jgi:integrase
MAKNGTAKTRKENEPKERGSVRYWRMMKGRLYARLQYKDELGKSRERLKPITDKRTARSVVESMRQELEIRGEDSLINNRMTFAEFAPLFKEVKLIPAVFANKVKVSGRKSNVDWAYKVLIEYFGTKPLRSIKPRDLEIFKDHRLKTITIRGKERNIATVNRELSFLRSMLSYAFQNDWIIQNPFSKIKGVIVSAAETERDRILSFEEEARLLEACIHPRMHLRPILMCALDTAMRSGEIFKMKWDYVDFVKGEIHIPQENAKTEKLRNVGMTSRLRAELEQLWESSPKHVDGSVFGISESVNRSWKTACRLAKVYDFRLHDCRHTGTTRMIASVTPHLEFMKITGHSQLKTFLRYLNITSDSVSSAANRLSEYVSEKKIRTTQVSEAIN